MREQLGLRLLMDVMGWDIERATGEFDWLRLMSRFKYDEYRDYMAGSRFIESLVKWLRQFVPEEREVAYEFVRKRLVFIGDAEMQRLIEAFFPQVVYYDLLDDAARALGARDHQVLRSDDGQALFKRFLRSTIFMALSDGARIDALRRANFGLIGNDQVLVNTQVEKSKWIDLLDDLRKDLGANAAFTRVYLIDDFTASGTTLCRHTTRWKGKLPAFYESVKNQQLIEDGVLAGDWQLHVHHLIGTHRAETEARAREKQARAERGEDWFSEPVTFTFGMVLNPAVALAEPNDAAFLRLSDAYYNPDLETEHTKESDIDSMRRGYGGVALPLVLVHNTPNNSMPLVWAELDASPSGPSMIPLFRRRQRYD